jgi:hypothetical protein
VQYHLRLSVVSENPTLPRVNLRCGKATTNNYLDRRFASRTHSNAPKALYLKAFPRNAARHVSGAPID